MFLYDERTLRAHETTLIRSDDPPLAMNGRPWSTEPVWIGCQGSPIPSPKSQESSSDLLIDDIAELHRNNIRLPAYFLPQSNEPKISMGVRCQDSNEHIFQGALHMGCYRRPGRGQDGFSLYALAPCVAPGL